MYQLNVLLFLLVVIKSPGSHAFCAYNLLGHTVTVSIPGGIFGPGDIAPGEKTCCHWSECGGTRDKELDVWLTTSTGVTHIIGSQAGGCIYIQGILRESSGWNWPQGSFLAEEIESFSYKIHPDIDGHCNWEVHDREPYINRGDSRSLHFLVTADPQYWTPTESKAVPDQTIATMRNMFNSHHDRRGFIVAGDLVQWADYWWDNFEAYDAAFDGRRRYLFDGVGNHDVDPKNGWSNSINHILQVIGERNRVTVTNRRGGYPGNHPDYSWNWDDVHFVQLNVWPGQNGGLAWLKEDLGTHVGNSGNPVVLIHHYGFDGLSRGSWTNDTRKDYWDIIKGYNIIAIFTGHLHTPPGLLQYWEGDNYLNGAKVPFFVSGAAMHHGGEGRGLFLEVTITESHLKVIRRYGNDSSMVETASIRLSTPKLHCTGCIGNARNQTFDNIPRDDSILTIYPNPAVHELHIDVLKERSTELISGLEVVDGNWNEFIVPGTNITNPVCKTMISISQLPPHHFICFASSSQVEQLNNECS